MGYPSMEDSVKNYNSKVLGFHPVAEPARKAVAILGTVPHKMKAPFDNEAFEIWAIAHACLGEPLPRVDRIFEIHKWDEVIKWESDKAWKMHPEAKVILQKKRAEVKGSTGFPFDRLAKKFQIFEDRSECLMTNSISWMVALAIDEGFTEIHIYGVNMSHSSEYGFQKPSCEYYLGLAKGLGIKIYIPAESDMCKSFYLYGKDEEKQTEMLNKLDDRITFLQNMHNQYVQQQFLARDKMNMAVGTLEFLKTQDQNHPEVIKKTQEWTEEYNKQRTVFEQSRDAINQHIGSIEDVKYMQLLMKQ